MRSPRNQLRGTSRTFDIFSDLELTRLSLKKGEFSLSDVLAAVAVVDAKAPYYLGDGSKYLRVRTGNLVHLTLSPNRVSTMFRCVSTTCASLRASSPIGGYREK